MSCPICNHTELNEGAATCPQCGSDLEVFTHIESAKKEHFSQKKSVAVLAALLAIVVVSWGSVSLLSGDKQQADEVIAEVSPSEDGAMLSSAVNSNEVPEELKKENENLKSEVASLTSEINKLKTPAPSATAAPSLKGEDKNNGSLHGGGQSDVIIHTVKRGESLWRISMKYFKNEGNIKKIAADNNIANPKALPIGAKLKIYK